MSARAQHRPLRWGVVDVLGWSVADFKSIGSASVDLSRGHLSILTGANSAGKSSLLQSILMMCQSVNDGSGIVLNGPLVSLGVPRDIVRSGAETCSIAIDYRIPAARPTKGGDDDRPMDVRGTVVFHATEDSGTGDDVQALRIGSASLRLPDGTVVDVSDDVAPKDSDRLINDLIVHGQALDNGREGVAVYRMSVRGAEDSAYVILEGADAMAVVKEMDQRTAYENFLSELEAFAVDGEGLPSMRYRHAILSELEARRRPEDLPHAWHASPGKLDGLLSRLSLEERRGIARGAASRLSEGAPRSVASSTRGLSRGQVREQLRWHEWLVDPALAVFGLLEAFREVAQRVAYIGPLRDDPRVISPLADGAIGNLPIGAKGERAASVLLSTHRRWKRYGFPGESKLREASMGDAVNEWARYLGVAREVSALNMHNLGVGLTVSSGEEGDLDLTRVGVGVSQAIPILVGVLSAPAQSIVIIEQPELHLHPSAQAKLADFLLYARRDVTFLIETHSEALVTRIRRRVVEGSRGADTISILFFEDDGDGSGVVSRRLAVNRYGNLNEWPKGFMDAVQEDSRLIMRAAAEMRREERGRHD